MDPFIAYLAIAIVALLIMSYFFSGAETAIISANPSRIHKMKLDGDKRACLVMELRDQKEKVIGTIILINNVVNIVASSLSAALFMKIWGSEGLLLSTIFITCLILLFAEVLPKTYAIQNPEAVIMSSGRFIKFFAQVFSPLTIATQYTVIGILKICGLHREREVISASDAMRNFISLHYAEGSMLQHDLDMLNSILDLAETEISQVMTHRKNIFALNISEDTKSLVLQILDSPHSRVPMWQNSPDNIVGIIHGRDLINALIKIDNDIDRLDLKKIIRKPWFIPETALLRTQLHSFRKNHKHLALVIDEYGVLQGLVTLEDILEEIVGEIHDEHDVVAKDLVMQIADNLYQVNGNVPVRDINRQQHWNLPDQEASTLSGMIINEIERIPEEGEIFTLYNFQFKIVKKDNNIITKIEIDTSIQDQNNEYDSL